jgi:hypothetical protein
MVKVRGVAADVGPLGCGAGGPSVHPGVTVHGVTDACSAEPGVVWTSREGGILIVP